MELRTLFLLAALFFNVDCDRKIFFYGTKVICKFNKDYFYNVTCGIKMISREKQRYSAFASFKSVIIEKVLVRMTTYYKFRTEFRPLGIKINEDLCRYFKFVNGTKLLDIEFFRNVPKEIASLACPIKGPMNLTVAGLEINPYRLPDFAPVGEWYFTSHSYTVVEEKEIFLTEFKNYFEVRYRYD